MTEDQLPAAEPESWLVKLASIVPRLGGDDDIRDLNEMVEGVRVTLGNEVDLNERVFDVPPPRGSRGFPPSSSDTTTVTVCRS